MCECIQYICVYKYIYIICVTWAAERLLGCDAPVAGGAQGGGGHSQGGEQVTVAGPGLPVSGLLLSLLQTLLLLILNRQTDIIIIVSMTTDRPEGVDSFNHCCHFVSLHSDSQRVNLSVMWPQVCSDAGVLYE